MCMNASQDVEGLFDDSNSKHYRLGITAPLDNKHMLQQ